MGVMVKNRKNDNGLRFADVDFFRGDSFQINSKDPINLFSIAVYIRDYLRSYSDKNDDKGMYDARLAISIDKVNKYRRDINSIFESAQIKSEKSLDLSENDEMMVFDSSLYDLKEIYSPSIILLDALLSMLSKPQSEILREIVYDRDASISEIAEKLGKSKQVVYKTIKRGSVDKIIKFLDAHLSLVGMRFF
ncbi:hypothetical protein [Acinetobacter indicus]|uniref:hypothetical protein n=1 Tax=Acinetobacter indicus TaxID=756892 RepID=UPI000948A927|nr:hypothetical protein [Acinetobacter indicus]